MDVSDYNAEVELLLPLSLLSSLEPSNELVIKKNDEIIFGGLVYTVEYSNWITNPKWEENKRMVKVSIESYNLYLNRRTTSNPINLEPSDLDPNLDKNTTGALVAWHIDTYMTEEGITKGNIEEGARIAEYLDIFEFDTNSMREIIDTLAAPSGASYFVDMEKKLHFASDITRATEFRDEEHKLIAENHNYWDIEIEKTLEDYFNKLFVIGGYPAEDLEESQLDYEGRIKYVLEDMEEISRMAVKNNNTGVWGKVIRDEAIEFWEVAEKRAESEFLKFGKIQVNINVTTNLNNYKPGDKVLVSLQNYAIPEQLFSVRTIVMKFNENAELEYELSLTNQELIGKSDFMDIIVNHNNKLNNQNKNKGNNGESSGGGSGGDNLPEGMNMWLDMQDMENVFTREIPDEENSLTHKTGTTIVTEVLDKIDKENLLWAASYNNTPEFKSVSNVNYMSFDYFGEYEYYGNNYFNFSIPCIHFPNKKQQATEVFIVYRDRTPKGTEIKETEMNSYKGIDYIEDEKLLTFKDDNYDVFERGCETGAEAKYINGSNIESDISIKSKGELKLERYVRIGDINGVNGHSSKPNWNVEVKTIEELLDLDSPPRPPLRDQTISIAENNAFIGDIAEIITYNRTLSREEAEKVTSYLLNKYNIQRGA